MIRKISFCVAMLVSTTCFAGGREIEYDPNILYGNPWIEASVVNGVGPFNAWPENLEQNSINFTGNFYIPIEFPKIYIRDLGVNETRFFNLNFNPPNHLPISFQSGTVPEPSSILLTILSFLGIRWIKK